VVTPVSTLPACCSSGRWHWAGSMDSAGVSRCTSAAEPSLSSHKRCDFV
jgi:hypothetical protein